MNYEPSTTGHERRFTNNPYRLTMNQRKTKHQRLTTINMQNKPNLHTNSHKCLHSKDLRKLACPQTIDIYENKHLLASSQSAAICEASCSSDSNFCWSRSFSTKSIARYFPSRSGTSSISICASISCGWSVTIVGALPMLRAAGIPALLLQAC